jgi:hypothetical protein
MHALMMSLDLSDNVGSFGRQELFLVDDQSVFPLGLVIPSILPDISFGINFAILSISVAGFNKG